MNCVSMNGKKFDKPQIVWSALQVVLSGERTLAGFSRQSED